ncbi:MULTISPECIES: toluene-4-monooxygenase system B family protein [unclassified Gordonia (in: high G+C Gram-positive bacteria)]|uniref:toluene-4-monooxygenase system B family protein n=1 Tax=unclassified Gordonia (in: high G+C Gram-positive bacteria) TaxID=2657482 RepID=UPI0009ADF15B|nr:MULTISPECIES: toluene-4-monooxygenase system B family protein [unclassified Gordonia (in: high G+C Gram-positive bacteria)]MDF3281103.1 toluene-4-monooxygenase system B family protein [Gordonia sp. N1V]OPX14992.1 isoprene monooxygenase hydroxylase, gamma subunit [Gordonia sp. i37]
MAPFPITGRFVTDFVPHLVAIDTEDTWDEVAKKVALHSVGRRVAARDPHPGYDVLLNGKVLPPTGKVEETFAAQPVPPLQWFDVRFRETAGVSGG